MELTNSKRLLYSANHVSTELSQEDRQQVEREPSGALRKLAFVNALRIGPAQMDYSYELAGHELRHGRRGGYLYAYFTLPGRSPLALA